MFRTLVVLIMLCLALAACTPGALPPPPPLSAAKPVPVKVAVVVGAKEDSFQMSMQSGAQDKARELGIEFATGAPQHWMSGLQRQVLDNLIAQQPTALCIAAVDPQDMLTPLQEAFDAGVDIFSIDTYIGSNGGDYTSGDVTFPLSYIA